MLNKVGDFYKRYAIRTKSGKYRNIEEPLEPLKQAQKELISFYRQFTFHPASYGIEGKSTVDNAYLHRKAKYILKLDIYQCFTNTTQGKIVQGLELVKNKDWVNKAQQYLKLCLLDNRLPTGAPTSPILCNIALTPIDYELEKLATEYGYTYTRYIDDIHMSIENKRMWSLKDRISDILEAHNYKLNKKKTRWLTIKNPSENVIVTGIRLGQEKKVPRKLRRKVRAMLQNLAKKQEALDQEANGYLSYIRSIDHQEYVSFLEYYQRRLNYIPRDL